MNKAQFCDIGRVQLLFHTILAFDTCTCHLVDFPIHSAISNKLGDALFHIALWEMVDIAVWYLNWQWKMRTAVNSKWENWPFSFCLLMALWIENPPNWAFDMKKGYSGTYAALRLVLFSSSVVKRLMLSSAFLSFLRASLYVPVEVGSITWFLY